MEKCLLLLLLILISFATHWVMHGGQGSGCCSVKSDWRFYKYGNPNDHMDNNGKSNNDKDNCNDSDDDNDGGGACYGDDVNDSYCNDNKANDRIRKKYINVLIVKVRPSTLSQVFE